MEMWTINIAMGLTAFVAVFAVLKSNVKDLKKNVDILSSKMNFNETKIDKLNVEKKQFLKFTDIDSRFASKESVKSLETLCDKQFQAIIETLKKLETKIDNFKN